MISDGLSKTLSHESRLDDLGVEIERLGDDLGEQDGEKKLRRHSLFTGEALSSRSKPSVRPSFLVDNDILKHNTATAAVTLEATRKQAVQRHSANGSRLLNFLHRGFSKSNSKLNTSTSGSTIGSFHSHQHHRYSQYFKNNVTSESTKSQFKSRMNMHSECIIIAAEQTFVQSLTGMLYYVKDAEMTSSNTSTGDDDTTTVQPLMLLRHHNDYNCVIIHSLNPTIDPKPFSTRIVCRSVSNTTPSHSLSYRQHIMSHQYEPLDPHPTQKNVVLYSSGPAARSKLISMLKRVSRPEKSTVGRNRRYNSLNMWIQEAKNLPHKKKYYCEIYLNGLLHARTSTKPMSDILFWGEQFQLSELEDISDITVQIWRAGLHEDSSSCTSGINSTACISSTSTFSSNTSSKKRKSHPQLVGQLDLMAEPTSRPTERWYSATLPTSTASQVSGTEGVMLRASIHYSSLTVLPLDFYRSLLTLVLPPSPSAIPLLTRLEAGGEGGGLRAKEKHLLAQQLVMTAHLLRVAGPLVAQLVVSQGLQAVDDPNLVLRGNSLASKAMETYLKQVTADQYLQETLADFVARVQNCQEDCEVDPSKTSAHGEIMVQHQDSLVMHVEMLWAKIIASAVYLPTELKSVFAHIRRQMEQSSCAPEVIHRVLSSCIFLRLICPAVLCPSLFNLPAATSSSGQTDSTRTLTLVAKCIQCLANFAPLKEDHMLFMNSRFIIPNIDVMTDFLNNISAVGKDHFLLDNHLTTSLQPHDESQLAIQVALLHHQLEELAPTLRSDAELDVLRHTLHQMKLDHDKHCLTTDSQLLQSEVQSQSSHPNSDPKDPWLLDNDDEEEEEMPTPTPSFYNKQSQANDATDSINIKGQNPSQLGLQKKQQQLHHQSSKNATACIKKNNSAQVELEWQHVLSMIQQDPSSNKDLSTHLPQYDLPGSTITHFDDNTPGSSTCSSTHSLSTAGTVRPGGASDSTQCLASQVAPPTYGRSSRSRSLTSSNSMPSFTSSADNVNKDLDHEMAAHFSTGVSFTSTKKIRGDLQEVRQKLDKRVRQLLLSDLATCKLELERIELLVCLTESLLQSSRQPVSQSLHHNHHPHRRHVHQLEQMLEYLLHAHNRMHTYIQHNTTTNLSSLSALQYRSAAATDSSQLIQMLETNQRIQHILMQLDQRVFTQL